jgi:general secretion pathway protein N
MPKHRLAALIALGVVAVLAFAVATLPASVAGSALARAGIAAVAYDGSVWNGSATGASWQGATLGDLQWTLEPWRLLRGRLGGHARLTRPGGSLDTDFDVALSGVDVRLSAVTLAWPIEALAALPLGMPKGWSGRVTGTLDEVAVRDGWPAALRGQLDIDGLVAPPPRNVPIGSYRAIMPHPNPAPSLSVPSDPANLTARVDDKTGPFDVDAQLTLSRNRAFAFEGTLAPRGPVPPAMERALQLLGPPDAAGRRPFSVGGVL